MTGSFEAVDGADAWDADLAEELIGTTLLVGLTHVDHDDRLDRREQIVGTVVSVDPAEGIVLRRHDTDALFTLAPVLEAIEYAAPGVYQLTDADTPVENPDFTALITVRSPRRN